MKTTLGKRIWSAILALVMVASLLSVPVMAEGTEDNTDGIVESNVVDVSAEGGDDLGGVEATPTEAPTPTEEPTPEATEALAEESGNTDGATATAASVSLTLCLPEGLSADGTDVVTRTVNADGAIDPIVISSEDEGAFSAALAEAINKNSSISENSLHITYNANDDTLTLSGTPSASVELDMEEILIAAMEESGAYDAELTPDEHYHSVCGEAYYCNTHKDAHEWHEWNGTSEISYTDNFEHLYLTQSVTRSETLTVESGKTLYLCLNGNTITGPSGKDVITVATGGTLIITDCQTSVGSITHAENATGRGITNNGILTLWNGSITGNTASGNGAGVYNNGTFTMSGTAKITNCTAAVDGEYNGGEGGGVYNVGSFTMSGTAQITSCFAVYTGGVYNDSDATFNMTGGEITGCSATGGFGGGVRNWGTFNMSDGSIAENRAASDNYGYGGGVWNNGTFNMTGGSITKNSATSEYDSCGGGVYNFYGTFNMTGGEISDNTTNGSGGGVYQNGSFTVSGTPIIKDNVKGGTKGEDGVYTGGTANNVELSSGRYITVKNGETMSGDAGVYITGSEGQQVVNGTTDTTGFFCDAENYGLVVDGSNLKIARVHKHKVCCDSECSEHDNKTWQAWNGKAEITYGSNNTAYVYLTGAVTLDTTLTVASGKTLYLCLNGQTLIGASGQNVINVNTGASLTITDCGSSGKITHNTGVSGRGISSSGTLNLYGGAISGNTIDWDGAGLNLSSGGTFNMYGGVISENNDIGNGNGGGGVYVGNNTAFNLYGGSITGNSSKNCGGGVFVDKDTSGQTYGTYNMYGGSITGNSASDGGGGVWNSGIFNMSGNVTITDNTVNDEQNNVYLPADKSIAVGTLASTAKVGVTGTVGSTIVTGSTDKTVFTSDDRELELVAVSNGLMLAEYHEHNVCVDESCEDHDGSTQWTAWTSNTSLPTTAGNYYLENSVTLSATWECNYNVNLCLNGQTITGAANKNVITVNDGASLTITDCQTSVGKITHAEGATGRGITNNGILTLWNGSITGNNATYENNFALNGGGVENNGTFTMYGGAIKDNMGCGGGTGVYNGGTFTMKGGSITGNKPTPTIGRGILGGGVMNRGTFTMEGGTISGNSGAHGGGVYVSGSGGAFILKDGTISDNTADCGGGVAANNGSVTMSDGSITNNQVTNASGTGGGVYVEYGTFTMEDGEITGNTSNGSGGGVGMSASFSGTFTMIGGEISSNTASYGGGGVNNARTFNISGSPTIKENRSGSTVHNVSGNAVNVTGDMDDTAEVYITGGLNNTVVNFADGVTPATTGFKCDNEEYTLVINDDNNGLKLVYKPQEHCVCGKTDCSDSAHGETITWQPWTETDIFPTSGYYYLTSDISATGGKYWEVSGNITLCLNGYSITCGASASSVIRIKSTGSLTITDCKTTGKITAEKGVGVDNDGTFTLWNGNITSGTSHGVNNSGTFKMNGGSITDCSSHGVNNASGGSFTMSGGGISGCLNGVYNCGTFEMSGGTISRGEADTCGGVVNYETFTMSGGKITGSTTYGVENNNTFTMSGGTITECSSHGVNNASGDSTFNMTGGRITNCEDSGVYNKETFNMTGGTISGNTATGNGGGVYNGGTFTMSGGEITNCSATDDGGGVYNADVVEVSGTAKITGCTANDGGAIYNFDNHTVTIKGGTFTKNSAVKKNSDGGHGGFICNYGTLNISGGTISNNTAYFGGGVYNSSTFTISGGTITQNDADNAGGGVYHSGSFGLFNVSGTVNISGNTTDKGKNKEAKNNVYLVTGATITVESGTSLSSDAKVYINKSSYYQEGTTVVNGTTDPAGFYCDAEGYVLASNGSNGLKIVQAQTHCVCGSTTCTSTDNGHSGKITWTAWTSATSLPTSEGNYYLTQDVELNATWQCGYNVNLCLNGQTITGASGQDVITVASDASLTITDCGTTGEITHNSDVNGRGIYNNGTLILWNGSITGNTASGNGAGVYNNGTFTMSGGSITNNNYTNGGWPGGGVYNTYNCTFNMTGGSITGNKGHTGGGVENAYGATFNMSGGSITGNSIGMSWGGGGVWNSGTLNISGKVEITGNTTSANATENVYLYNYGIIKVNGELDSTTRVGITGSLNQTAVKGSVDTTVFTSDSTDHELVADGSNLKWVAVHKHCVCGKTDCSGDGHDTSTTWTAWTSATSLPDEAGNYYLTRNVKLDAAWTVSVTGIKLCLNGKTITGASGADVIYLNEGKTLDITDCTTDSTKVGKITHAEGATGRGIYNRGTLNFWNGCVTGNRLTGDSDKGAGVCNTMGGNPIFNMYGGSITGNYCKNYGGGVFNDKTWNMSGGEISGNSVVAFGGGVNNKGTFNMTGGSITGNSVTGSAPAYGGGGVYNDSGTFKVSGNVTISGNKKESADNNVQGTVTAIGNMGSDAKVGITGGEVKGSTDTTVFTSDNADLELVPVSNGLKLAAFHKHCVCVGDNCGESHSDDTKWTGIASLSANMAAGSYYLTQDVELTETWIVKANINLCLNGKTITGADGKPVIDVWSGRSLTITDCGTTGKITHAKGATGRGIFNDGTLNLWNGSITGNTVSDNYSGDRGGGSGGGVYNSSTFTMYGGEITDCTASNGGGVYMQCGTFKMSGGEISGNTATTSGGGVFFSNGTFTMSGGEITDCTAGDRGGGVLIDENEFTLSGGSITNCTAKYGGGVFNSNYYYGTGTFKMSGGEISGNTATTSGGGVYNGEKGLFAMTGGKISGNTASANGGGVYVEKDGNGTFKVSGSPVISSNTSDNVYLSSGKAITVDTAGMGDTASIGITGNLNQTVVTGTTSATGFSCDNTDYELVDNENDGLKLVAKPVTISGVELLNEADGAEMTDNTKVYDGEAVAYTTGSAEGVDGVTLTYTWQKATTTDGTTTYAGLTAAPSDAGSYRLHVEAKKNNVTHGSADYYFTISKATPAADDCTVTMSGWTYGGTASTPVTTSQYNGNTATVVYTDVSGAVVEQPTNAGTYTATATFPANDNYNAGTATTTFTISPKELTVDVTAANKTYDGDTTATVTATLNTSGVVSGDKVELNTSGVSAAFENANAGTGKTVNLTGSYTLGGTSKDNYTLTQPTGIKANISQRELTITGATVASKTYDGKTDATITAVEFSGLQNSETLTLGEDYTVSNAAYDKANATGDNAATKVTFTVTLQNTDNAKNYKLKTAEGTQSATIGKADHQSYTVEDTGKRGSQNSYEIAESWIVDGGSVSVTSVSDGSSILGNRPSCNGRVLNYELTQGATETQNATVTLTVTSDNYNAYTITVTIKVAAKTEVTITVTPADEYVYNGQPQAPTTISVSDGKVPVAELETKYVGTGTTIYDSATAPTNAGSYTMTVRVADSNLEYYGSKTVSFTIEPKAMRMTATAVDRVYNGKTNATVNAALVAGDKVGNDDVTLNTSGVTAAFETKGVGTSKKVILTGSYTLDGADAGNYSLTQPTGLTATISEATLTVKDLAVASKLYDGTNTATISGTPALVGVAENDTVTLAAGTPTFSSVNVGEDIAISFTNFSISGDDADNYELTQPTGIKANINAYNATKNTEYSVNSNNWINTDFVVTPTSGWKISYTNTADGNWVDELKVSEQNYNGTLEFYLRNDTSGIISEKITETYRIDKTVPTITGAENGKTYCAAVTLTITDANLDRVTLNGETVELTADGKLTLDPTAQPAPVALNTLALDGATDGEQTVVATDAAGNSTTITLTVNDGHTWGEWTSNGDNTHNRACQFDAAHTETEDCHGGKATCKDKAECEVCGEKYGEPDPHNHADLEHVEAKDATTSAEGNIEYWHCEDCGKYFKDADATEEITKTDTVTAKRKDSAARTGDESNAALWLLLLVGSGAGMATLGKKKRYSK